MRDPAANPISGFSDALVTPQGLCVQLRGDHESASGLVVMVHGGLDGAASFARVARRLEGLCVAAYDRRGYRASRTVEVRDGLEVQIDDLVEVIDVLRARTGQRPVVVVGHSYGGLIALGLAARKGAVDAVVAYEAPFPWLREHPYAHHPDLGDDPRAEAEAFFRRMVSDAAWERLGDTGREERRADGAALLADLRTLRGPQPLEPSDIEVPVELGCGDATAVRHRESIDALLARVPSARLHELDGAGHGAHLSSPERFCSLVRDAFERCAQAPGDTIRR